MKTTCLCGVGVLAFLTWQAPADAQTKLAPDKSRTAHGPQNDLVVPHDFTKEPIVPDANTKAGKDPISVLKSNATVGGTFIKVGWSASQVVGAFVYLSEDPIELSYDTEGFPNPSGPYLHATTVDENQGTEVVFTDLNPDRKYFYAILPHNDSSLGNGQVITHYRVAKTLKRSVSIETTILEVVDDSDDLSDGEMAFTFLLMPATIHPKEAGITDLFDFVRLPGLSGNEGAGEGYLCVSSGEILTPSIILKADDVGDKIRFAVSGYDDDVSGVYDVLPLPYPFEYTGAYDTHHGEANANFWTIDIDGGTFETIADDSKDFSSMEKFELKLKAAAPENDITCLEFKVHFTVSVFYQE